MNNTLFKIKKLYIPYIYFPNLKIEFKKIIEIDEMEAILFSYIYHLKENGAIKKSKQFFNDFFETFNLDKDRWFNFFIQMISEKIKNGEIQITNETKLDENLLCGEIELHKILEKNISKNKFIGLDSKKETRKIVFNKILYESIDLDPIIFSKELDKLYKLTNEDNIINSIIDLDIRNLLWENEKNIIDNEKMYSGEYKIFNITNWQDKEIRFYYLPNVELKISFNDEFVDVSSNEIRICKIFDKLNEKNISEIIIWSIEDSLKNDILDKVNELEGEIIKDLNIYNEVFKEIQKNYNFFSNLNKNIYIDKNHTVYEIGFKELNTKINKRESKKIKFLTKKYESKLNELIFEEIKNKKNLNLLPLISKLEERDKKEIDNFLISSFDYLDEYKTYKDYVISLLKNNSINESQIEKSFTWDFIEMSDFKCLVSQNIEKYNHFLNKNVDWKHESKLLKDKIINFIETQKIKITDNFLSKFKNEVTKKIKIIVNKINKLSEVSKEIEYWEDFDIEINLIKNEMKQSISSIYIQNEIESNFFKKLEAISETKMQNCKMLFDTSIRDLQRKLETFAIKNKNGQKDLITFQNLIKDKQIKTKFNEIRKYRNDNTHTTKIESNKINKKEIKKVKSYLNWLDDHKNELNEIKESEIK